MAAKPVSNTDFPTLKALGYIRNDSEHWQDATRVIIKYMDDWGVKRQSEGRYIADARHHIVDDVISRRPVPTAEKLCQLLLAVRMKQVKIVSLRDSFLIFEIKGIMFHLSVVTHDWGYIYGVTTELAKAEFEPKKDMNRIVLGSDVPIVASVRGTVDLVLEHVHATPATSVYKHDPTECQTLLRLTTLGVVSRLTTDESGGSYKLFGQPRKLEPGESSYSQVITHLKDLGVLDVIMSLIHLTDGMKSCPRITFERLAPTSIRLSLVSQKFSATIRTTQSSETQLINDVYTVAIYLLRDFSETGGSVALLSDGTRTDVNVFRDNKIDKTTLETVPDSITSGAVYRALTRMYLPPQKGETMIKLLPRTPAPETQFFYLVSDDLDEGIYKIDDPAESSLELVHRPDGIVSLSGDSICADLVIRATESWVPIAYKLGQEECESGKYIVIGRTWDKEDPAVVMYRILTENTK